MSEPSAELPPPRYEQVGNWQHLICDEQEWLARPGQWGIEKLPDEQRARKQDIFDAHLYGWMAGFIECAECRERVLCAFTDRFDETVLDAWNVEAPHPECDGHLFRRTARNWQRGVITRPEAFGRFVDVLCGLEDALDRKEKSARLYRLRIAKARALALELVGPNPFRPITFDQSWRTDTAVALARTMYDSREFGAMPILADAIQDAGCENAEVLNHCRDPHATHVRGCWVVDLVLGLS